VSGTRSLIRMVSACQILRKTSSGCSATPGPRRALATGASFEGSLPLPRRRTAAARNRVAITAIGVVAAVAVVTTVAALTGMLA
jgi:hypothetical protein